MFLLRRFAPYCEFSFLSQMVVICSKLFLPNLIRSVQDYTDSIICFILMLAWRAHLLLSAPGTVGISENSSSSVIVGKVIRVLMPDIGLIYDSGCDFWNAIFLSQLRVLAKVTFRMGSDREFFGRTSVTSYVYFSAENSMATLCDGVLGTSFESLFFNGGSSGALYIMVLPLRSLHRIKSLLLHTPLLFGVLIMCV